MIDTYRLNVTDSIALQPVICMMCVLLSSVCMSIVYAFKCMLSVASNPIPGGCSLCPVKNRGSFVKGIDQNFPLIFLFASTLLTKLPPVFNSPYFHSTF